MAYLSKETILSSYKELSHLTEDPSAQGATQITSFLRYFFALARFYSLNKRFCDTQKREDRENFISYVGEVVSINNEVYTANFFLALKDNADYAVGSNFFSVNVVRNSLENNEKTYDFPKRGSSPLFTVRNGELIIEESYYHNLSNYLKTLELRGAFAIWLVRNDNIEITNDNYNSLKSHLYKKYSQEVIDSFIPPMDFFENVSLQFEDSLTKIESSDIRNLFHRKINETNKTNLTPIILYGPPGTGKTHSLQTDYIDHFEEGNCWFTTFHQSFSYEEFVEGLKPILNNKTENVSYHIEKGVFYNACDKAAKLAGYDTFEDCIADSKENRINQFNEAIKDNKFVLLCIDEINRGNVASIFGDLISLIEPSKRLGAENELILTLPYSKERFGVPANLLIVGTMNTADRSIQLLDSALRRRFKFKELLPDYSVIKNQKAAKILKSINARVRALINKDSQIGHSYFIDIPQSSEDENTLIMKALVGKIIPLLEEYFYNDHTKIRFVLSEDDDTPHTFYVKDKAATDVYNEFAKIADFDEKMDLYELNPDVEKATEDKELANGFLDRWN